MADPDSDGTLHNTQSTGVFLVTPFLNSSLRMVLKSGRRLLLTSFSFGNSSSSSRRSVMVSPSGQERFCEAACSQTFLTVLRETPQLRAMFRSLNPKLFSRRISRYWVMEMTSFTVVTPAACCYSMKESHVSRSCFCMGGSGFLDRWFR